MKRTSEVLFVAVLLAAAGVPAVAQVPPSATEALAYTGLFRAAHTGDVEAIRSLLARGEKPTGRDGRGRTPLHVAAHSGQREAMRLLVAGGADPNALIESVVLGDGGPRHTETLAALVEAGANVNIADRSGQTPLILARSRGYREMASILSRAGA